MYKTVLLPVDLDEEPSWRKALPTALEYCRASDADLHVLTVVPDLAMGVTAYLPEDSGRKLIKRAKDTLAAFIEENVPETLGANKIVVQGTVYQRILEVAEEIGADLIVMAAHRPALKDYLLGPNAARVVRHATCSVLVVRE
jgi:nucleotide-binding universal stress UspA family protein